MDEKRLTIVDDFYSQPMRIRQFARECEWLKPEALGPNFPGIESRRSFFSKGLVEQVESLVGAQIEVNNKTLPFGIFSLGFRSHEHNRVVHIDPCEWTAVVYLTAPEHCSGGTALFRHRASGLTAVPPKSELWRLGYNSADDYFVREFSADQRSSSAWEVDIFAEMKFNRLILYQATAFHAATEYFGSTFEDGRLIQLFFFNT